MRFHAGVESPLFGREATCGKANGTLLLFLMSELVFIVAGPSASTRTGTQ